MSILFKKIKTCVEDGRLKEPFSVIDINKNCNGILEKSRSFLSKHAKNNSGNYIVYFERVGKGKYKIYKDE